MRPLWIDILNAVLPVLAGVLVFFAGKLLRHLPRVFRISLITAAIGIVVLGALTLARLLPLELSFWLSRIGGASVLLAGVALFLLGIVWGVPKRSFSSGFIVALAFVADSLILVEMSGRLWMRTRESHMFERYADKDGTLQQSSGATCSPTAAVMLLSKYGIHASEGEIAYLAGTSLFGTDAPSVARALQSKVGSRGWRVEVVTTNYDACLKRGTPFIAHVEGSSAGHALLVESMTEEHVDILDPADGQRKRMSRNDFLEIWDGTSIEVIPTNP